MRKEPYLLNVRIANNVEPIGYPRARKKIVHDKKIYIYN